MKDRVKPYQKFALAMLYMQIIMVDLAAYFIINDINVVSAISVGFLFSMFSLIY